MADKREPAKAELSGKDVSKFWLYMGIIALCVAALLYMLVSAKPRVAPAVKNNSSGASSFLVRPAPSIHARRVACG